MFLSSSFSFFWLSKLYLPNPVHALEMIKEKNRRTPPKIVFFLVVFLRSFTIVVIPKTYSISRPSCTLLFSDHITETHARTRSICKVHLLASSSSSSSSFSSPRHSDCWSVEKSKACRGLFRVLLYL